MPRLARYSVNIILALLVTCSLTACTERPAAAVVTPDVTSPDDPPLANKAGSIKFAVIGDSGQWSDAMKQLAAQLVAQRARVKFDFVIMLGDNNYGDGSPDSFKHRFEDPYKPLLDAGVKFHAALGNHDEDIGE